MIDFIKAGNPFLDGMPRELHDQYIADFMTEFMKMPETNKTTDGIISFKYGIIVAFARKSWKLQPSTGRCLQIPPISEDRLVTNTLQNQTNTAQKNCALSSCVEKERLHAYTKQCTES